MRCVIALFVFVPSMVQAAQGAAVVAEALPEPLEVLFGVRDAKPTARRFLRKMLENRKSTLLACYRQARPKVGDGVFTARLSTRRKRKTLLHGVRSTLGHKKMVQCVEGVLGAMILDRPSQARVTIAFVRLPPPSDAMGALVGSRLGAATPPIVGGGTLTKNEIRSTIRQHVREVQRCYEKALQHHGQLAGKVVVRFTIGPSGRVESAQVRTSTIKDSPLERCIEGAIMTWVFPKPRGGGKVVVTYPFVLRTAP